MLNPSDSIVDWVLKTVPTMGAGWCPPGMLGIGIGGSAEKAMLMAKEALMEPHRHARAQGARARRTGIEELRIELYDKVNALGIGAQGLGGLVDRARRQDPRLPDARGEPAGRDDPELRRDAPRALHARRLAARRSSIRPISPAGPTCTGRRRRQSRRVDLDTLTPAEVATWKPGERCCSTARC